MGRGIKIPTPEKSGVGYNYTMYSTVPPWLRWDPPPLIDALTGVPGRLFPTCGSGVVSLGGGNRCLSPQGHPLWESHRERVSPSQLLLTENLSQFRDVVNPFSADKRLLFGKHRKKPPCHEKIMGNVLMLTNGNKLLQFVTIYRRFAQDIV